MKIVKLAIIRRYIEKAKKHTDFKIWQGTEPLNGCVTQLYAQLEQLDTAVLSNITPENIENFIAVSIYQDLKDQPEINLAKTLHTIWSTNTVNTPSLPFHTAFKKMVETRENIKADQGELLNTSGLIVKHAIIKNKLTQIEKALRLPDNHLDPVLVAWMKQVFPLHPLPPCHDAKYCQEITTDQIEACIYSAIIKKHPEFKHFKTDRKTPAAETKTARIQTAPAIVEATQTTMMQEAPDKFAIILNTLKKVDQIKRQQHTSSTKKSGGWGTIVEQLWSTKDPVVSLISNWEGYQNALTQYKAQKARRTEKDQQIIEQGLNYKLNELCAQYQTLKDQIHLGQELFSLSQANRIIYFPEMGKETFLTHEQSIHQN